LGGGNSPFFTIGSLADVAAVCGPISRKEPNDLHSWHAGMLLAWQSVAGLQTLISVISTEVDKITILVDLEAVLSSCVHVKTRLGRCVLCGEDAAGKCQCDLSQPRRAQSTILVLSVLSPRRQWRRAMHCEIVQKCNSQCK
jgi:hypothetical protein